MSKDVEILIVEGNLAVSEHLKHILEQHEYRVTVEHNGKIALDAARANPPQIVISAIEKAQTASPLNEELLSFMLESAKDYLIFTTDAEGRVTSWNAGAEHIFGYPEVEILGQNGAILFTPEDREIGAPEQELSTAVTEGRANDERWHLRKDGTRFWMSGMVRPHRDDAGRLQGFIKIGRDMTEQKRAEDALRRRERELSDFVDNATVGMQWIGGDGIIKWANKTELDLLGYTPEEYIGHHVAEFHADREVIENILERLTGDEALNDQEARLRCKDGTFRNVLINSNVFWEDGKFVHTRCFTRDITERKQAKDELRKAHDELERRVEERTVALMKATEKLQAEMNERERAEQALIKSEEHYRHIVETAQEGIWMLDEQAKTSYVNDRMAEILGYTADEMLGYSMYDFMDDEARIEAERYFQKRQDGIKEQHDFRFRRKDGTDLWAIVSSSPIIGDNGVFMGAVGLITDITDRKQAENTLIKETALNKLLQMIAVAANEATDIKDAAQICLDKVCDLTKWQLGHLILPAEDSSDDLVSADLWHIRDRERFEKFKVGTGRTRWSKGNGLAGQILKTGKPIWMVDVAKERHFIRKQWAKEAGIVSAFAFPILVQAKVMGVLEFFSTAKEEPDEKLMAVMSSIGNQLGQVIERKQAHDALRQSEANLAAAQRITHLGSWELDILDLEDSSKNPVQCSDEVYRIFGYEPGQIEVTAEVFYGFVHSDERTRIRETLFEAIKQRKDLNLQISIVLPDGGERILQLQAEVIYDEQPNKPSKLIGSVQDITERKRADEFKVRQAREAVLRAEVGSSLTDGNTSLRTSLTRCVESVVEHLDAAFARIWMLNEEENVLELQASAGMYTRTDGMHARVPVGSFKIGLIAQERQPHFTNDVLNDPRVGDREWARQEGMVAFAGYPLIIDGKLVGVIAMFARYELTNDMLDALAGVAPLIAQNIERKRAQRKSLEAAERFHFLAESLPQKIFTARPNGEADYFNRQWLDFSGLSFEQIKNWGWTELMHPEDVEETIRNWQHSLETGEPFELEHRFRQADSEYCWHLTRACAMRDDDGKVLMWIGSNTDIHEQKLAQEELKAARLQLETALDAGAIASWNYDILNNRIVVDKNMAQLFSVSPEDAAGGPVESYIRAIHPDDRQHVEEHLATAITSANNYEMEYRIVKSDGTIRWVEARGQIERDATGTATRMPGVIIDITERKQAQENLILSEERLQQSQKMEAIGTLTGGVAHDFNNMLTAILGNTQLAQRKLAPNDPIQLRLMEVIGAGNRAAELTRKLLAFSRRQHLDRRTVNLNDTVSSTMKLLERIIGEDVEVSSKYADDLPTVFADPGQIEQVVMNLAVNARDAMPSGGKLTIETSCVELDESYCRQYPYVLPGRYVQIRVSDTGTGMDEETQARIFEPYFTTKDVGKGTGLGLSMAHGIVNQHDGHINLYSEPGLGTTFKVYLQANAKAVGETAQAELPSFLGGTETILVAEDEETLRNLAKETLEDLGYTVLLAKNGEEAVELFGANSERIDLFLSDVVMPRMGGSEAYEQIRKMGGNVPLIFMTGYSSGMVQSRFVKPKTTVEELGAAVIQKPYSLEELGRIVREVLDENHKP